VTRQCELLEVNRTSVYYTPVEPDRDFENLVKNRLDYWHTKMPYMGVRKLRDKLQKIDKIPVGRRLIKRYMEEMGIYAMCPKPNLSKRNKQHKIYPYLLRNLEINRSNQVWAGVGIITQMLNQHHLIPKLNKQKFFIFQTPIGLFNEVISIE